MHLFSSRSWLLALLLVSALALYASGSQKDVYAEEAEPAAPAEPWAQTQGLRSAVVEAGQLRVIVQLDVPVALEGKLRSPQEKQQQREMIQTAQTELINASQNVAGISFLSKFETLPLMVLEIDEAGLSYLKSRRDIAFIVEDELSAPSLSSALPIIGSPTFNAAGYDGTGTVVAVLDTGVDVEHLAFTTGRNRIVAEGCFSTETSTYGGVYSVCPDRATESTVAGSADDCIDEVNAVGVSGAATDCKHGTHVAGIIGANDGSTLIGVAPDVDLIPVQVFSAFESYGRMLSFTSDQIKGLEYILTLKEQFNIVAVNMSLGGNYNSSSCDYDARRQAILNLQSVGVATIIASGNDGFKDGVGKPGCISEAITVGSSNDNDTVSAFSNVSEQIDLMAPGNSITSAFPNNSKGNMSGTSMATPMVAGAWALISESNPTMSDADKLELLKSSGKKMVDDRTGGTISNMARVDLAAALDEMAGAVNVSVTAEKIFFNNQSETFAVTVSNTGSLATQPMQLVVTLPDSVDAITSSISDAGLLDGKTISWNNVMVDGNAQKTFTLNLAGASAEPVSIGVELTEGSAIVDSTSKTIEFRSLSQCNIFEGFEDGWSVADTDWSMTSQPDGRAYVGSDFSYDGAAALILDDTDINGILNSVAVEIAIPLDHTEFQLVDFYWHGLGFYSTYSDTGLFMSLDRGKNWIKAAEINDQGGWEHVQLDLAQVAAEAKQSLGESAILKFQFMGDGNFDPNGSLINNGLIIDQLQINCGGSISWDGEGESDNWSDPLNWSPNLIPNGHSVVFDANSPLTSVIDTDFTHTVSDLIISGDWGGTLTQAAPLAISGDFLQQGGLFILSDSQPLSVGGDVILIDGGFRQTQSLTGAAQNFLMITDVSGETVKYGGYQIEPADPTRMSDEVTITIAGPIWGTRYCDGLDNQTETDVNRCFDISTTSDMAFTTRIWLDPAEVSGDFDEISSLLSSFDQSELDGAQQAPLTEDMVKLQAFVDEQWVDLSIAQMGAADERLYAEVDLDSPVPVMAQKVNRTPTAVKLSSFTAENPFGPAQNGWLVTVWFGLFIMSLAVIGVVKRER